MELNNIKGCGPKTIEYLNKLNIYNVDSLVRYYPYRYNVYTPMDITNVSEDDVIVTTGTITSVPKVSFIRKNFNKLTFNFQTNILTTVNIYNRAFMKNNLYIGRKITVIGKYNKLKNQLIASDIKLYELTSTKVEPVYHTVSGLKSSKIISLIDEAISSNIEISEIIPEYISNKYKLMDTFASIKELHKPTSFDNIKKAKLKLIYEELFEFMFKINLLKYKNQIFDDFIIKDVSDEMVKEALKLVPFTLTNDQINALNDIIRDYKNLKRMNRLILGDVGSGKTMVAFLAIVINQMCGYQSALLAPTEVLARQHYDNFIKFLPDFKVALLVGSLTKKEKNKIIEDLKNNKIDLLIGTHAMLEDNVEFANIGLVVTDEQHRFGVNQRKSLQNKGNAVDVLYMSATPIPRTYALTIYGDMDISYIASKPAGRKDIWTKQYTFKEMNDVVEKIESELLLHHQAYVVAPLIEDENNTELTDLQKIEETLNKYLKKKYNIGILHGKMKQVDKDKIMNSFKEGKIDILISTTVIEVGVDVSNATIMTIFNAERFGLATIHQLRGRVGRNSLDSYCLLVSDKKTERIKIMEESNDGFYISERDFEIRGSGDLFGVRQSGDMQFRIADIRRDYKILLQCKKDAEKFILDNIEINFRDYPYYQKLVSNIMNND